MKINKSGNDVTIVSDTFIDFQPGNTSKMILRADGDLEVAKNVEALGELSGTGVSVYSTGTNADLTLAGKGTGMVAVGDTGTATATAGAATLSKQRGVITSEALTTAAAAAYTLTLTNTKIAVGDIVLASVLNGTNTQGIPVVGKITPAAGSCTIEIWNLHASQALNGTIKIAFALF